MLKKWKKKGEIVFFFSLHANVIGDKEKAFILSNWLYIDPLKTFLNYSFITCKEIHYNKKKEKIMWIYNFFEIFVAFSCKIKT